MSVERPRPREAVLRLVQSVLAILIAFLLAAVAVAPAEGLARALGAGAESPELVVARTVGQFAGFALAGAAFLYYADDLHLAPVGRPTLRQAAWIVVGTVGLLAAQFGLLAGLDVIGVDLGTNQAITAGRDAPVYFLYMLPVSLLVVGPAEELLFRGIVQGELKKALPVPAAVALASLLFGFIHWTAVAGGPVEKLLYVLVAATLGLVLGGIYEYTGNLTVPALAHGAYNAVLFGLQYAAV